MIVFSGNVSLVQKFQSAGSLFFCLGKGRKEKGHAHKFARNSLYGYLKRNGKSLRNETSKIQILNPAHCKRGLIKAVIKISIAAL